MIKKITIVLALLFIVIQSIFIYALQQGGAEKFMVMWTNFGVRVPEYTKFVYKTIAWWWIGPMLGLLLLVVSLYRKSFMIGVITCMISAALTFALYWSTYAPHISMRLGG